MSDELLSSGERRRRAPLHHLARADNARFTAYALSQISAERYLTLAANVSYGGAPQIALHEAFLREASLALELIVKAVIAMRIEGGTSKSVVKVRNSHDVLTLWENDAGLPTQPEEDRMTLALAHSLLRWAGRYAAPTRDDVYDEEHRREQEISPFQKGSKLRIRKGRSISWEQFDRLYSIAAQEFCRLYEARHKRLG